MAKPYKTPDGSYRLRWTDENGIRRSTNIQGDFKSVCYEQKKREAEVEEIRRGLRAPAPMNKRFGDLCDYWLEKRSPQKRSQKDDQSIIRTHLRPAFGHLPLRDLTLVKVDEFSASRTHLNKKTLSNHLTLLVSLLRLAVDLNWLAKAPNIKKPKTHMFSHDYNFLRSSEEIDRFLSAALLEDPISHLMYKTAIYTGMRAGELAALRFSNISFSHNTSLITVQDSFNGLTKSGRVRYVPVLAQIYDDLIAWKLRSNGDLVFPNRDGHMFSESARVFQEVLHRTLDKAGFPTIRRNGKRRRYIVFHDLRHTFASHWVMNGGDVFKLQQILGHASISMTMRYAHLAPHAFADDFDRLGKRVSPKQADLLEFRPKA